jgi:hypothetical protein
MPMFGTVSPPDQAPENGLKKQESGDIEIEWRNSRQTVNDSTTVCKADGLPFEVDENRL